MSTNNYSPQDRSNDGLQAASSQRLLIKSTSIISIGTLSSRVFGFIRDVVLAKLLGTGLQADAFFLAMKIPNLFRDLVGEGATNAAIVPVASEYLEHKKKEEFWAFVNIVFNWGLVILSVITISGIVASPVIVWVIAPGFAWDPKKLELTILLTRIMFPYLIFIGLTAYSAGILYTFRSFVVPSFTPCLLNIAIIMSAFISSRFMEEPVFGLAVGVLVGGFLQLAAQIRPLVKIGMRYTKPIAFNHPGARKIGALIIPRILGSGVYQLAVLIDSFCASMSFIIGPGGIAAIYYANRIISFPMGIFSVAMASAALPALSGLVQKKDIEGFKKTVIFALENIFFVMCPNTIILFVLSSPIIRVLFQRGEFGPYSTNITALALSFYAIGLFAFGGVKMMVMVFYALQDTKTPVKVAVLCLAINAALNFILMYPLKVGGIALASSISGIVNFLILFYILDKRLEGLSSGLWEYFARVLIASVMTGAVVFVAWERMVFPSEFMKLFVLGGSGFIFYGMVCLILKVEQAHKIFEWIKNVRRVK